MTKAASGLRVPALSLLLFLPVLVLFFTGLTIPFVGPDEARYAQVAREMYERGDLVTPTLGGFYWFEKPALLYWMQIAAFAAFGVSEFSARLGPALCGLGTIASLWVLGRRVEARAVGGSVPVCNFANLLAFASATTVSLVAFSKGASFDIVVTFTITAALVSFFVFLDSDAQAGRRWPWLASFYVFVALSILAKGLIGLIFPFAIVVSFYLVSRQLPPRRLWVSLLWGLPLVLGLAGTWYVPMFLRHGSLFIDVFFVQHHLARFTSNKYLHPQPFYFFLWVLPLMLLPWTPFFVAGLLSIRHALASESRRLVIFAVCWIAVPLVFFSLSGSKLPGYILPAVPPGIVIACIYLSRQISNSKRWCRAVFGTATISAVGALFLLLLVVAGWAERDSVKSLFAAAAARGYGGSKVISLHTLSHNAEFYAAGRLVREPDGRQRRLSTIAEVESELEAETQPVLVLIPKEYISQLTVQERLKADVIAGNGELAIIAVQFK